MNAVGHLRHLWAVSDTWPHAAWPHRALPGHRAKEQRHELERGTIGLRLSVRGGGAECVHYFSCSFPVAYLGGVDAVAPSHQWPCSSSSSSGWSGASAKSPVPAARRHGDTRRQGAAREERSRSTVEAPGCTNPPWVLTKDLAGPFRRHILLVAPIPPLALPPLPSPPPAPRPPPPPRRRRQRRGPPALACTHMATNTGNHASGRQS